MLPLMMYAGSARALLTFDNKRKFIKVAQMQELILHTVPMCALIWYNNTTMISYNEDLFNTMKVLFILSSSFNLIEVVFFYYNKVSGKNLEVDLKTG